MASMLKIWQLVRIDAISIGNATNCTRLEMLQPKPQTDINDLDIDSLPGQQRVSSDAGIDAFRQRSERPAHAYFYAGGSGCYGNIFLFNVVIFSLPGV